MTLLGVAMFYYGFYYCAERELYSIGQCFYWWNLYGINRQKDRYREIDGHADSQRDKQINRQTDKERLTDRETNRQTHSQTNKQTGNHKSQHAVLVVGSEGGSREECNLPKTQLCYPDVMTY